MRVSVTWRHGLGWPHSPTMVPNPAEMPSCMARLEAVCSDPLLCAGPFPVHAMGRFGDCPGRPRARDLLLRLDRWSAAAFIASKTSEGNGALLIRFIGLDPSREKKGTGRC